eukprot:728926-Pyramimonas_sp.AAC.3
MQADAGSLAADCTTTFPTCCACIICRMAKGVAPKLCAWIGRGLASPRPAAHASAAISRAIMSGGRKSSATVA